MLTPTEANKLQHDIKRASTVLKIIKNETDRTKQDVLMGLLILELDNLSDDITTMKEGQYGM